MEVKLNALGNFGFKHHTGAISEMLTSAIFKRKIKAPPMTINFIDNNFNETVAKNGNRIGCNVKYTFERNFEFLNEIEKNKVYLKIIEKAFDTINSKYPLNSLQELKQVLNDLETNNFSQETEIKSCSLKSQDIMAKLILKQEVNSFKYFVELYRMQKKVADIFIMESIKDTYFAPNLFHKMRFSSVNKLVIESDNGFIQFNIDLLTNVLSLINNSPSIVDDYYNVMKVNGKKLLQ